MPTPDDLRYAAAALSRAARYTRDSFELVATGKMLEHLERHAARLDGVALWLVEQAERRSFDGLLRTTSCVSCDDLKCVICGDDARECPEGNATCGRDACGKALNARIQHLLLRETIPR